MIRRICIVIQNAEFARSAGVRVRYDRFREGAASRDVEMVVKPIADVLAAPLDCDTYVFCKTFIPLALVLAAAIRRSGRTVGQDLFDDYFSQYDDQRLAPYRAWLRQMAVFTDYAICTTPRMRDVLKDYLHDCPITIVEDPVIDYDPLRIGALADRKAARMRDTGRLRLAWFGIGDNPFFPVGVDDLCAPSVMTDLARLCARGWHIDLTIATNLRALSPDRLARLRRLPVDLDIVLWTEEQERNLLATSDVALLPVGEQDFSRAKSLNRALTTLNQGCQVWSLGAPLYARLGPFIYRTVDALDTDLRAGRPRMRSETVPPLTLLMSEMANAFKSSDRFTDAAFEVRRPAPGVMPAPVLLHGRLSAFPAHKLAGSIGGLSVRTPFTTAQWNFPIRFDLLEGHLVVRMTPALARRFKLEIVPNQLDRIGDLDLVTLTAQAAGFDPAIMLGADIARAVDMLVSYPRVMAIIADACRALFPGHTVIVSDTQMLQPGIPGVTR